MAALLSHMGVCVADLNASKEFYERIFGFVETYRRVVGDDFGKLMSRPSYDVEICILALGEQRIELIHHRTPPAEVHPLLPTNAVGYSHLAFYVDDVDATGREIDAAGGSTQWDTRLVTEVHGEQRLYMMALDPSGIRVEVMQGRPLR